MGLFGKVSTGFKNAFSTPKNAVLTVATGGIYGVVKENPKGAVGAATGAASGFVASGGNPIGLIGGGIAGGITGGTSRGNLGVIAQQGAVSGGIIGALSPFASSGYAALKAKLATVGVSKGATAAAAGKAAPTAWSRFTDAYAANGVIGAVGSLFKGAKAPDLSNVSGLRDALNGYRDKLATSGLYPDGSPGDGAVAAGAGVGGDEAVGAGGFIDRASSSPLGLVLLLAVPGALIAWMAYRWHKKRAR